MPRCAGECVFRIERTGRMLHDAIVLGRRRTVESALEDGSLGQLVNVAGLPGLAAAVIGMPDIHHGYGFPIGAVAGTSWEDGVISPGGVGYDINCGVRLYTFAGTADTGMTDLPGVLASLARSVPSGLGSRAAVRLSRKECSSVLESGSAWAVERGYGVADDLASTEDGGALSGADPGALSRRAVERGMDAMGTLGSGNHFVEIGMCDRVFEPSATLMGLREGLLSATVHCGSRGLGHQVCSDHLRTLKVRFPPERMVCPIRTWSVRLSEAARACSTCRPCERRPTMPMPTGRSSASW